MLPQIFRARVRGQPETVKPGGNARGLGLLSACRRGTRRAFSIVEVLIALGVLAFGAMGAYEQFVLAHKNGLRQLDRIQAANLAHQELEQLRACSAAQLLDYARATHAPLPYPEYLKFTYQNKIVPRPDGLLEITVQMGWDMPGGRKFEPGRSVTVKGLKAP